MDIIIAIKQNNLELAKKSSQKLTILLPNEILPHLMHIDANFNDLPPNKYAGKVMNYLKVQKFSFNDLYFGPFVTRYLYIQQNLITGKLFFRSEEHTSELQSHHDLVCRLLLEKKNKKKKKQIHKIT